MGLIAAKIIQFNSVPERKRKKVVIVAMAENSCFTSLEYMPK